MFIRAQRGLLFRDQFDRSTLGDVWSITTGSWAIQSGTLVQSGGVTAELYARYTFESRSGVVVEVQMRRWSGSREEFPGLKAQWNREQTASFYVEISRSGAELATMALFRENAGAVVLLDAQGAYDGTVMQNYKLITSRSFQSAWSGSTNATATNSDLLGLSGTYGLRDGRVNNSQLLSEFRDFRAYTTNSIGIWGAPSGSVVHLCGPSGSVVTASFSTSIASQSFGLVSWSCPFTSLELHSRSVMLERLTPHGGIWGGDVFQHRLTQSIDYSTENSGGILYVDREPNFKVTGWNFSTGSASEPSQGGGSAPPGTGQIFPRGVFPG